MRNSARAEWDPLTEVLVHRPGIEVFFGLLAPYSFLYERAFSLDEAGHEHAELQHVLTEAGVTVHRLDRFVAETAARKPEFVDAIRRHAERLIRYTGPKELVERARRELRRNLDEFDARTLFHVLLLRPSVDLARGAGSRAVLPTVSLDGPLANLHFLRDQQALSPRGFVLGRMAKPQRREEARFTASLLRADGATITGEVRSPGTFEGGDLMPLGEFALLGHGDRTNASGVAQLLAMDLGFDEIAVVRQPRHPALPDDAPDPMIDMHVDTYLNVPGRGLALGCDALLRAARVTTYRRRGGGRLVREAGHPSLAEYLASKRFEILPLSSLEQMGYATNFLCVRDRKIVAVEVEQEVDRVLGSLAEAARRDPHRYAALLSLVRKERATLQGGRGFFPHTPSVRERGIEVTPLALQEITGGYGGAHCLTCAANRGAR